MNYVLIYVFAGLVPIVLFYRWISFRCLHTIPTIGGPSAPGLSYIGAFRVIYHARELLQEGYMKYKGGIFKIALLDRWMVVISGPKLIEELRKMPDDQLSFRDAINDLLQEKYSFGRAVHDDPYHVDLVRSQLTRHLANVFPDVRNEINQAFTELIPATDGWTSVPVFRVIQTIVARASNRVFVGLPMCRHEDYLKLVIKHTLDVVNTHSVLNLFPDVIKPIIAFFINDSRKTIAKGIEYLRPIVVDRQEKLAKYGDDWSDKPTDMLMWIIEEAKARGQSVDVIVSFVLLLNFAAIHTSSNSFTHALYHLAANPEYLQPLRQEAETVIQEDGWSKAAMNRLRKLDSFMRESQRMNGINGISLTRKALVNVMLSNGARIPRGTLVAAAASATHLDEENYAYPDVFDAFRFSRMRDEGGEGTKHQFVSTSVDYISFGHGKHACPGRFFAANELKAMMAHVILNYDVKFKNEGVRPPNEWFALNVVPSPDAEVLFRKRQL